MPRQRRYIEDETGRSAPLAMAGGEDQAEGLP